MFSDGIYIGISQADENGYVIADVSLEKDKIKAVALTGYDRYGFEDKEINADLAGEFVNRQDADIQFAGEDEILLEKCKEAVGFALEKARIKPSISNAYFNGTFVGFSKKNEGGSYGMAWVTIEDDEITRVVLEEFIEEGLRDWGECSYQTVMDAKAVMESRFVDSNSAAVDVYSGATISSVRWMEAVWNALGSAQIR